MMAEADVTGPIQVGQISSPMPEPLSVAVSAGIDYAEDEARPDVVADVNMTDVSGDQSVCIYPVVAADLHTSPIAFETDSDRFEDDGHEGHGEDVDVVADPHTLEVTVDDVAAWPAVHALATMAHAPSSDDSMTSGLETTQETAVPQANPTGGVEFANDVVNQAPGAFISTANNLSMIEDGGDELQFHEQGQGGGEAPYHSPNSATSASQSMNVHLPPIGHSLAHQNVYIYHHHQIGVHAGDSSPHTPTTPMYYLGSSSMQGLNNAHSLEAEHQLQNTQSAQPVHPVQADGSGTAPLEQALNTAVAAHNGQAFQAPGNYAAALSTGIGGLNGPQTIETANVQYLGSGPSDYTMLSTDGVNTAANIEVGFGEDFEESSSDGSSPQYFEGYFGGDFEESLDEDSEVDTEEEEDDEDEDEDELDIEAATNANSHVNLPASLTSPSVLETMQQPQPAAIGNLVAPPPQALSTIPMYNNLSPANYSLVEFLVQWSAQVNVYRRPDRRSIDRQLGRPITCIRSQEVCEDQHDLQGINWEAMGVTRKQAREFRSRSFRNYVSVKDSDQLASRSGGKKPWNPESYFRFRRMHVKTSVHLAHFQLRNLLASTSRSCAFYATSGGAVRKINTLTGTESVAMRFSEHSNVQISTIAADQRVLIAGGFAGEYCISDLTSEYVGEYVGTKRAEGTVTKHTSGISNHIQIHSLRNASGPLAAFASNDLGLRILDLNTGRVISAMQFSFPVNCTAISPDRRLRVVVGDSLDAYIIAAEPERSTVRPNGLREPEVLKVLSGHKDYGFACAWAPDGYTLATGNQDRAIKIWDARKWSDSQGKSTPVVTLYSEMAGVRSLHFSPAGSGKRVLVAAEEADFVNIIDAQTFRPCQTLDVFGEIGGVSLASAGRDLLILCADKTRGGLLHFDRCDAEMRLTRDGAGSSSSSCNKILEMRRPGFSGPDWLDQPGAAATRRLRHRTNGLRLRTAAALDLEPY